jgi:drug/metabolite transporter (DMT)-like permease
VDKWKGPFSLFLAFSLAGTSVVASRFVAGKLGTFTITAVSLFLALLFLIPASGKRLVACLRGMTVERFLHCVLQALFGIFLFRMFFLMGLIRTSSVEAGILTGATPAITAVLATVFLKEAPDWKKVFGILCTMAGVLLIQGVLHSGARFSPDHLLGNFLVLCAAGSESAFNVLSRIAAVRSGSHEREPVHPLVQTTLVTLFALLLCVIPALFESPAQRLTAIGVREWLALLWYGLFVTALAFFFWYAGIKRCGAFTAAAFSGMMPFVSLLLSVLVLGEQAGFRQWTGGLLVVAGMVLIGNGGGRKKILWQDQKGVQMK